HQYLPDRLVLGDPAARDAAIHALQACIPQATILPVGVDRLIAGVAPGNGPSLVRARGRSEEGDLLVFAVEIKDEAGHTRERWEGLRLRVVDRREPEDDWPEPLLGPYLERRFKALVPGPPLAVAVQRDGDAGRGARSDHLFRRLLG